MPSSTHTSAYSGIGTYRAIISTLCTRASSGVSSCAGGCPSAFVSSKSICNRGSSGIEAIYPQPVNRRTRSPEDEILRSREAQLKRSQTQPICSESLVLIGQKFQFHRIDARIHHSQLSRRGKRQI